MKNEFTEGPYRVVSGLVVDQHDNVVADCRSMERLDPDSGEIKPHKNANKTPHISPVEAGNNAHLLAGAPEMLAQLDDAYSEIAYLIRHELIPVSELGRIGKLQANMTAVMLKARRK